MVYSHKLQVETGKLLALPLGHHHAVGPDAVLLELGLDKGQSEGRTKQRNIRLEAQQVRHAANVVLVPVGKHNANHVIQAVTQVAKVGQNHVYAGLVLLWKKHSTVNDQDFTIDFEHGHIATDFTDASQRNYPKNPWAKWRRGWQGLNHLVSFLLFATRAFTSQKSFG